MLQQQEKSETRRDVVRIVVVEDYKLTRLGVLSVIKSDPSLEVVGDADSGEKAVEMIKQLRPDVVLMDLGLPGMNGVEATQQVKTFDPNIKVIVYTSHEREEEVVAALGAGANAYCLKDSSPARLLETIRLVAEGAAWLDPAIAHIAMRIFQRQPVGQGAAIVSESAGGSTISTEDNPQLTERELQVLSLLIEGKSNTEIGKELIISAHTAKAHVCSILQKLAVNDRVQAAVKAIKQGLV